MASLDWSQCPAVESIPGKVSGAWVLRGTRTPVKVLFENLEAVMSIEEVIEQFPLPVSNWTASWRLWHVLWRKNRAMRRPMPSARTDLAFTGPWQISRIR
jgi:uncharacterized protein (DUF433 family)